MLREILSMQLLESLIKEFTDSYFVNQAVVDILEPSRPLAFMLDMWNNANNEKDDRGMDISVSYEFHEIEISHQKKCY